MWVSLMKWLGLYLSLIGANLMCTNVTCGQRTLWASPAIAGTSQDGVTFNWTVSL